MAAVPDAAALLARLNDQSPARPGRMTDQDLGGLARLDALAQGDLWVAAQSVDRSAATIAAQTAQAILAPWTVLEPAFSGPACRDGLAAVASRAEAEPDRAGGKRFLWQQANFVLGHCVDLAFDGLAAPARRLLEAAPDWTTIPHTALALARLAGMAEGALNGLQIGRAHV